MQAALRAPSVPVMETSYLLAVNVASVGKQS